jgi:hypothetical protein
MGRDGYRLLGRDVSTEEKPLGKPGGFFVSRERCMGVTPKFMPAWDLYAWALHLSLACGPDHFFTGWSQPEHMAPTCEYVENSSNTLT